LVEDPRSGIGGERAVVRTGDRAAALVSLLESAGLRRTAPRKAPRLSDLPEELAADVYALYRDLGGGADTPALRPGSWDLDFTSVVVELDEELHFNRYRELTLSRPWAASLPWTTRYRLLCRDREPECLRAAQWGQRWTSASTARMFGNGAPPGDLAGAGRAPRWKQRALYDALKDAYAATAKVPLARLSVWDEVSGELLGSVLERRATVDPAVVRQLLELRTVVGS
jgi:hypothetical protein